MSKLDREMSMGSEKESIKLLTLFPLEGVVWIRPKRGWFQQAKVICIERDDYRE